MKIIYLFLILITILSGCQVIRHHSLDFNASSNSKCIDICVDYMYNLSCQESVPSYSSEYFNGENVKGECSCFLNGCFK